MTSPVPEIYSRNWAFISATEQAQLAKSRLLIAGLGLGSVVATLAARHGIGRFILADGDVVETSNLNRQAFLHKDIGRNKARATADLLKLINDGIQVEVLEDFVDADNLEALVRQSDLVVNTIDWGHSALFACADCCRRLGKPMFFPLNIGWGGALYIFLPDGPSLREFFDFPATGALPRSIVQKKFIQRAYDNKPPSYIAAIEHMLDQLDAADWRDPQLGAAVYLNAALLVTAAVAMLGGKSVRVVPEVIYCDLLQAASGAAA